MKKKLAVALGVGAVLAVLASTAFAAVQVVFKAQLNPAKAGKSTALDVQIASSEPGQPQPPIMNRIVIKFNKGGKYNNAKFPRCNLASLQALAELLSSLDLNVRPDRKQSLLPEAAPVAAAEAPRFNVKVGRQ